MRMTYVLISWAGAAARRVTEESAMDVLVYGDFNCL